MKSIRNTLILAGLLSLAAPAATADQTKKIGSLPAEVLVHERGYGFNPELGRAWIEVHYSRTFFEDAPVERMKVAVDGLSYDSTQHAVIYQSGGQQTVCATARERGFGPFRNTFMAPTGLCDIALDRQTVTIDNGFNVWDRPRLAVTFAIPEEFSNRVADSGLTPMP